jgi:hypothetical protein
MGEVQASLADGWEPRTVHHLGRRLDWTVREVLESWTHPGWPERTYGKPVVERRHRLRVFGPLPGDPGVVGEFVMVATAYGDRPHWWIRPDDRPPLRPLHAPVGGRARWRSPGGGR